VGCTTHRRIASSIVLGVVAVALAATLAPAQAVRSSLPQPATSWRYWDSGDGFVESYTSGVALGQDGGVWVKHGSLGPIDRLDGYFAPHFPDPRSGGELAYSPGGAVWMWAGSELKRLFPGNAPSPASGWDGWKVDAVSEFGEQRGNPRTSWDIVSRASPELRGTIAVVGRDNSHALILLPDRVLEFDAERRTTTPVLTMGETGLTRFNAMVRGADGGVIIAGQGGWGRLNRTHDGAWVWKLLPEPPPEYVDFDHPVELPGEKLFLTGRTRNRESEALSFDGTRWHEWYRGESGTVQAWPGVDGAVWVRDGNRLLELAGGQWRLAEKSGSLSGVIQNVIPEAAGRFWVAASQGLAHASPPLWQTPPESPPVADVVNSIAEDTAGNVWFLAANSLLRYGNSKWTTWPLPKGETAWAIFADGLQPLPDGRIVIRVTANHLLVFDPLSSRFKAVSYPGSRTVRMISPGPGGSVIAETVESGSVDPSLDLFDGDRFRPLATHEKMGDVADIRSVRIAPNGDIYTGGLSGLGVWHNGKFRRFSAADGFTDPGAFAVYVGSGGRILAGGRDGLFELHGGKWQRLQNGLDRVRRIIIARDGTVWAAAGTGIYRCRAGNCFSNTDDEGLPSGVAYSVFEDSRGRIWAGTALGLSLFNPSADSDPPIARFDEDQNSREVPPGGRALLVFGGIDKWKLTPSSRLLFSWRMDGGAWSAFTPRNTASFERLGAGPHRFEVRAMDRNGNIGAASAPHAFSVLVPWYAMRGFRVISAVSVLLIGFFFTAAVLNYRHRGRLIHVLNERNKLERDRQKILQMTASRAPLPLILNAIAEAVAQNCPGGVCLLINDHERNREVHCEPPLARGFAEAFAEEIRSAPVDPRSLPEWRSLIGRATGSRFAADYPLRPISPAGPDVSGVGALLTEGGAHISESAEWVLETFTDLAAGAIENNLLYRQLAYQARHDALTDLPNRAYFEEELGSLVKPGSEFAILYVDLDRFKQINDTLGHRVGDVFLQQVALRFKSAIEPAGMLFRIGGDEFVVLAASDERSAIERLAAKMLGALGNPVEAVGNRLFASASIGISLFPSDGDDSADLLKNADIAMYRSKAKGRNRFECFTPEMISDSEAALGMEQSLRSALENGGFRLVYQPWFTPSGSTAGFEALLRLSHPDRGLLDASEFIKTAEESELIVPIGEWVLREACRQLGEWRSEGLEQTLISVNVSPQEISRANYADDIAEILLDTGIPPSMIQLELTESGLIANLQECSQQMKLLRELGVRLAIDDFGTGYSSFNCLQNLPVDVLKIDRSFLCGAVGPDNRLPLIQAIVALGRNMGLTLVAAGVETEDQLSLIHSLLNEDGDFVQGNLLSRPLAAEGAREFLAQQVAKLGYVFGRAVSPNIDSSVSMAAEHCAEVTS